MRNTRLEIRLLSGAGGAEISGVDVAQDLDDDTIGEIRDALNEHCVVFFRDQELDVARHRRRRATIAKSTPDRSPRERARTRTNAA